MILEVSNLHVAYDGVQAVKGINLSINAGELICLIGANGAGKTTTLKALAGMQKTGSGVVTYQGGVITNLPSHDLLRRGIALVPEGRGIFGRLTVMENLQLGAYSRRDAAGIARDLKHVQELFPRLAERRAQTAGTLSGGEQQMLAIARALMSRPKLLMLDEPSMGLSPLLVQKIFETIRNIAAGGVTILLVEQNAHLALQISQRGYVLENGQIKLADSAANLMNNEDVKRAYLGG
jgi:branched-chain amino acid transport system ATP-binding protein